MDENQDGTREGEPFERRTLLKGFAAGLAGSLAAPDVAAGAHLAHEQPARSGGSPTLSNLPRLLDDHQRRTLSGLAESLVPGSVAAGVVDLMDRVAAVDAATGQRRLLNAIARFDQEAQAVHGKPWNDLDAASRLAILRRVSEAAAAAVPDGAENPANTTTTLPAQFKYLRDAVATAYLRTEAGLRELGWAGRTAWTELPGCPHPPSAHG